MKEGVGMGTPGRVLDGRDLGPGGAGRAGEPRRQRSARPPLRAAWETASSSAGMRVWWLPYQHTSQHTPSSSEGKGKIGVGGGHPPEVQTRHAEVARGNRAPNPLEAKRKSHRASEPRFLLLANGDKLIGSEYSEQFYGE